ncbi:MAG: hypothetical protein HZB83_07405 [Deltaproteobacteria bacterium]|nr:hypothetical protein [Deltaproteobacteria bacterium]
MRKLSARHLIAGLVVMFFALVAVTSHAGEFSDLKKKIGDARDSIVAMLKNKDKRGPDQQKLVKDSADAVSAALAKMHAPKGKDAQFKELADTWAAFKKTREAELVPLILAGKQEDADKLAGGVQKERFKKIMDLSDELDK